MTDQADSTTDADVAEALSKASLEILGRMPWSSNATFLVELECRSETIRAVYKPAAGEEPLWDFPPGLWKRETAAYELSRALGWGLVPITVQRTDAPFGEGSLQLFIEARFEEHYFTIREMADPALDHQLRLLCAFDLVANSADRKGGHCLIDTNDRVWAIDNGLTFHPELKLRTVLWDFAGDPIPEPALKALKDLCQTGPPASLEGLLDRHETDALLRRAERAVADGTFPFDPSGRRYPWPLV